MRYARPWKFSLRHKTLHTYIYVARKRFLFLYTQKVYNNWVLHLSILVDWTNYFLHTLFHMPTAQTVVGLLFEIHRYASQGEFCVHSTSIQILWREEGPKEDGAWKLWEKRCKNTNHHSLNFMLDSENRVLVVRKKMFYVSWASRHCFHNIHKIQMKVAGLPLNIIRLYS